jgi:predicted lipid-binding transport protein (Tim44 family)
LLVGVAHARPGGGGSFSSHSFGGSSHSFGGSSHSFGGSSSYGHSYSSGSYSSGGDSDASMLVFAVLVVIAIPVVVYWFKEHFSSGADWSTSEFSAPDDASVASQNWIADGIAQLRARDANFSLVLLEDFLYALYAEVHTARGKNQLDRMSAYVAEPVREQLRAGTQGPVETVIVGAMSLAAVTTDGTTDYLTARFEANYSEAGQSYWTQECWRLSRAATATSRAPEKVRDFGCPNCGAALEATQGNVCTYCKQTIDTGAFDWLLYQIDDAQREERPPILTSTVEEQGTELPTRYAPDFVEAWQALTQKDPAITTDGLAARIGMIFSTFQSAWSARDLKPVRAFLSDRLFQTQLNWAETYKRAGLRNLTDGARILRLEYVRVDSDRFYDAVTVRLYASSLDYTVSDQSGDVVSGSRSRERTYSEYWTLIRGSQRTGAPRAELTCPNCGAELDINMAGACTFCKARVSAGEFDFVLSKIEQDEVYSG